MEVELKDTSFTLAAENTAERVYLKTFMGKDMEVKYREHEDGRFVMEIKGVDDGSDAGGR